MYVRATKISHRVRVSIQPGYPPGMRYGYA